MFSSKEKNIKMSWFIKISREWGQPNQFSLDFDKDPYSKKNPDYPWKSRKSRMTEDSPGMGSDTHSTTEQSGQGTNEKQPNSLTSFNTTDEIMDSGITGEDRPRTWQRGGPSIGDSPMGAGAGAASGTEDDGAGSYILRHTPNDSTPEQVARRNNIKNDLKFQNRPPKRVERYHGQNVNVF